MIPETHRDLLERPLPAVLVTLLADGRPQASVVWFELTGDLLRLNSERGRAKMRNMERDGRVTLLVVDPDNQHRYVEIRGDVVDITEDGALDHRAALDRRYLGPDHWSDPAADAGARVVVTVRPVKVVARS
jgi:PPOX class probable F420-dependent enzyme